MNGPHEFWRRVDRSGSPDACWPWLGSVNHRRGGYGQLRYEGRVQRAHRVAYELTFGQIPDGLTIDHVRARGCTTTACCNPAHMEAVPLPENISRKAVDACWRGHLKTAEHGYPRGTKWRCRSCEVANQRIRRQRRAAA